MPTRPHQARLDSPTPKQKYAQLRDDRKCTVCRVTLTQEEGVLCDGCTEHRKRTAAKRRRRATKQQENAT
jgi:hypothetical protein